MPGPKNPCRHLFTDGHQCGSPALRGELLCYFHHVARRPAAPTRSLGRTIPQLPAPDDLHAIQHGLAELLRLLATQEIDAHLGSVLLRTLNAAGTNLARIHRRERTHPAAPVTDLLNHPTLGPIALPAAEDTLKSSIEGQLRSTEAQVQNASSVQTEVPSHPRVQTEVPSQDHPQTQSEVQTLTPKNQDFEIIQEISGTLLGAVPTPILRLVPAPPPEPPFRPQTLNQLLVSIDRDHRLDPRDRKQKIRVIHQLLKTRSGSAPLEQKYLDMLTSHRSEQTEYETSRRHYQALHPAPEPTPEPALEPAPELLPA